MLKELHDELLAKRPEGANHDPATCEFCAPAESASAVEGGSVKTYTEEEVAELREQIATLVTKVQELSAKEQESVVEAKVAEAQTQLEAKINELQSQLDAAVLEAETAKRELAESMAYLQSVKEESDVAAAAEARKADRIAKVREVASFPDTYVEANGDRWAAMEEAAFEAVLADWSAISKPAAESTTSEPPAETAMETSRDTTAKPKGASLLREVLTDFRTRGIDPRTV